MGECESTCHTLMWFQVYIWGSKGWGGGGGGGGGGVSVCANPNVLRKEDTVLVKYLCNHQ